MAGERKRFRVHMKQTEEVTVRRLLDKITEDLSSGSLQIRLKTAKKILELAGYKEQETLKEVGRCHFCLLGSRSHSAKGTGRWHTIKVKCGR